MTVRRETPSRFQAFTRHGWFDRVTALSLYGSEVTDGLVPDLCRFSQLRELNLGVTTEISPAGLRQLRDALPNCTIRTSVLL